LKKLAIIGASYLQLPLVKKAKDMGIYTICFSWEEGAVCKEYCNKFYPISIIEKEQILEICKIEKISGITSIASDLAVTTLNFVANKLNLIGNSPRSGFLSTNKYEMRNAFKSHGILVPCFTLSSNLNQMIDISSFKYPVIVKPVDRSGSKGITFVTYEKDLQSALNMAVRESFANQAIIEEFINGKEISVESISWKGKHYIIAYTDKVTSGPPHFVELEHHQPSEIVDSGILKEVIHTVKKGLDALEIKNGASHSELIITDQNRIYTTEIGARMGGDFIGSHLVSLSTGYDFLRGVINLSLNKFSPPLSKNNKYSGVYFLSQESEYIKPYFYKNNHFDIEKKIFKPDTCILTSSNDRSGYLIYQDNKKITIQ